MIRNLEVGFLMSLPAMSLGESLCVSREGRLVGVNPRVTAHGCDCSQLYVGSLDSVLSQSFLSLCRIKWTQKTVFSPCKALHSQDRCQDRFGHPRLLGLVVVVRAAGRLKTAV